MPGRVVSLPLVMVRRYADNGLLFLERTRLGPILRAMRVSRPDSRLVQRAARPPRGPRRVQPRHDGAPHGLPRRKLYETRFAGGYSGSTRNYNRTVLSVSGTSARARVRRSGGPRIRFFGVGLTTRKADVSDYATQTKNMRGELLWGWKRDGMMRERRHACHSVLEFRAGPHTPGHPRRPAVPALPSYQDVFPDVAGDVSSTSNVDHLIGGASDSPGDQWRAGIHALE